MLYFRMIAKSSYTLARPCPHNFDSETLNILHIFSMSKIICRLKLANDVCKGILLGIVGNIIEIFLVASPQTPVAAILALLPPELRRYLSGTRRGGG